jgi:hypothetical protein
MNTKDFLKLGVPLGGATRQATDFVAKFILGGGEKSLLREEVAAIAASPSAFVDDPLWGEFARALLKASASAALRRGKPAKYRQWGEGRGSHSSRTIEVGLHLIRGHASAVLAGVMNTRDLFRLGVPSFGETCYI